MKICKQKTEHIWWRPGVVYTSGTLLQMAQNFNTALPRLYLKD